MLNDQIITSDGATVASTVTYLLPVAAMALGILVLDEHHGHHSRGYRFGPGRSSPSTAAGTADVG